MDGRLVLTESPGRFDGFFSAASIGDDISTDERRLGFDIEDAALVGRLRRRGVTKGAGATAASNRMDMLLERGVFGAPPPRCGVGAVA
jgi:hypothetical protein